MRELDAGSEFADVVRFLLDGEVCSVANPQPAHTVLNFLREDLHRTGTKEGCAEGDCGACTVVIADADDAGKLSCRAVNACIQFLPTVDGKALYTVESLKRGQCLHPVQQAMADSHGSQCGFCTPGFVMSLFALYKTQSAPTRADVDDALAGNLCRCTGYRPIVAAAREMYALGAALPEAELDWVRAPQGRECAAVNKAESALLGRLLQLKRRQSLVLPSGFHAPRTIAELARLRAEMPNAHLLAGGTDVGIWVTKQLRDLEQVIYIGEVAELRRVEQGDGYLEIGAGVSLSQVLPLVSKLFPGLAPVFRRFASPPIRNAATLGGNIANGSPIGDSMPCLIALGSKLVLRSQSNRREIAMEDFYLGYQKTALNGDEFVEKIRIPVASAGQYIAGYKVSKRFDQDISAVLGAFAVQIRDGVVSSARVAYGGMAAVPSRARHCEAALCGKPWNAQHVTIAADALAEDFKPIDDMRASATYRMRVARNLLRRFYLEHDGRGGGYATRVDRCEAVLP